MTGVENFGVFIWEKVWLCLNIICGRFGTVLSVPSLWAGKYEE